MTFSEDKNKIAKYANSCGVTSAVVQYKPEFPSLRESTVRGWLNKYRAELKLKVRDSLIVISQKKRTTSLFA